MCVREAESVWICACMCERAKRGLDACMQGSSWMWKFIRTNFVSSRIFANVCECGQVFMCSSVWECVWVGELHTSVFLCVNVSVREHVCASVGWFLALGCVLVWVGGIWHPKIGTGTWNRLTVSVQAFPANFPMAPVWSQRSSLTLVKIIFRR